MAHTRRMVLKAVAVAGTAFIMPVDVLDAFQEGAAASLGEDRLPIRKARRDLTRSFLRNHVGSDFIARTPGGSSVTLRLVEVEDLPNAAASGQEGSEDAFAARFTDSSGFLLSQGTYTLRHDALGAVSWFLVPVDQPISALQTYEAIFNNTPTKNAPPHKAPPRPEVQPESGAVDR